MSMTNDHTSLLYIFCSFSKLIYEYVYGGDCFNLPEILKSSRHHIKDYPLNLISDLL